MKKYFTLILSFCFSLLCYSQSNYNDGFDDGYKAGYCYGRPNSIPPIPPIPPIPNLGESSDNYQDGYNRGFVIGQAAKRKDNSGNTGGSGIGSVIAPDARKDISDYYKNSDNYQAQQQTTEQNSTESGSNNSPITSIMVGYPEYKIRETFKDIEPQYSYPDSATKMLTFKTSKGYNGYAIDKETDDCIVYIYEPFDKADVSIVKSVLKVSYDMVDDTHWKKNYSNGITLYIGLINDTFFEFTLTPQ